MMITHDRTRLLCLLFLAFFGGGIMAHQSVGSAGTSAPSTSVATVDLKIVMEGMDALEEAQGRLQYMGREITAEEEEWDLRFNELEGAARQASERSDDEAVAQLQEELTEMALNYKAWKRYRLERMDARKSKMMHDIYQAITAEVTRMSVLEGYDIVLTQDAAREFSLNKEAGIPAETQIMQQIRDRRFLHASPAVDISEALLERLNNTHASKAP